MVSDKLAKPPQAPPLFTETPTSIVDDAKRLIEYSRNVQDQIVRNVQPEAATFENVLRPLAHAENAMNFESRILGFYKEVSVESQLRDSSGEATQLLNNFGIETAMREDLFQLVDAVFKKNEELDPESYHLLMKQHKGYIRSGMKLPAGPRRDRLKEIQTRLQQLNVDFGKNQNEENGDIWFDPQELKGIPEDVLAELEKGTEENTGKLRLTLEVPHRFAALQYAKNSETRKRVFIAFENEGDQNVSVLNETVILRDEAARLLGYPNHAAFRIEEKMAKKPETVNAFLNDLRSRLSAGGRRELETLKQLKKADLDSREEAFDGQFFLWDLDFYKEILLEKQYSVDEQKIAEYFPLQTTIQGMLGIFQHLFGLVFVEITGDERNKLSTSSQNSSIVWHEDVQVFSAWDNEEQSNEFLGYLYLDIFPRENKFRGVANFNLQPGFVREDGTRQYPATALVCNFTKPTSKKPSLLNHPELVALFHELGHGIHDLVSRTIYSRFHGTETVIDFGEAPSQMLEHWCWTPSSLKSLSRHYSSLSPEYFHSWEEQAKGQSPPPEKIPDEMIDSLVRAKHVNGALFGLRMLHLSIFDMMIHEPASHEQIETMNLSAEYNKLRKELMNIDGPEALGQSDEWGHGQASIRHLMDEYDAGLYGYLYSRVFADDIFYTVFKPDPMDSKAGRRYRYAVLEKGGSQDEMKTVVDFLGRDPKTDAFYKELGLS
ncbi:hypothetical protein MMC17_006870 [Xylographa soralifera]|nr:hypothetical protein [Xylographa soralifera]MCJ1383756.1 hypothetical protein [Xylographa soralifera]